MNPAQATPTLCIVGAQTSTTSVVQKVLRNVASSLDWPVRVVDAACEDEMDETVALVLLVSIW